MTADPLGADAGLPLLRRLPAPQLDPPYDDERESPAPPPLRGALALPLPLPPPAPPPRLRVVPTAGPVRPKLPGVPAPGPWSGRFLRILLEVLAGVRPVGQLAALATPPVCAAVSRRVAATARNRDLRRAVGSLRSVHVSEPVPHVAEVCAVVDLGSRVRALAIRLEAPGGEWRCTALRLG